MRDQLIEEMNALNFHDSCFRSVEMLFSSDSTRSCNIVIDYYNWEGNQGEVKPWKGRKLTIKVGMLAHAEFYAPDVLNRSHDIDMVQFTNEFERFRPAYDTAHKSFAAYRSPLFDTPQGPIAMRFCTQNWDSDSGYLLIIGTDISLAWDDADVLIGQTHIPIKNG